MKKVLFLILLLLALTSCRSNSSVLQTEYSDHRSTAVEQASVDHTSLSSLCDLHTVFSADSMFFFFENVDSPVPWALSNKEEARYQSPSLSDTLHRSNASYAPPARNRAGRASMVIYGAHFESEEKASTGVESISSDSISSVSATSAHTSGAVSLPTSLLEAPSKHSSIWNKLLLRPFLILLLAALICYAVRAAIRRFL